MTFLIDLGNSRLKWATLKADGTLSRQQAMDYAGWKTKDFERALAKALSTNPEVWVASVAAPSTRANLVRAANRLCGKPPNFIDTTRACAGVINGYRDPWRLGVDRWMALIGARELLPKRNVLVADIGTALTLDMLRAEGRHAGGVIIPGTDLMQQSLLRSTGGILKRAEVRSRNGNVRKASRKISWHATSTAEAIHHGAQLAVAAAIDTAYVAHRAQRPRLLLTGGGAETVKDLLRSPCMLVPDLVLQGLLRAVRDAAPQATRSRHARAPHLAK